MKVRVGRLTLSINNTAFHLPDLDSFLSAVQPVYKNRTEEERKDIDSVMKGLYKDLGKPQVAKKAKEKSPDQKESAG